MYTQDQANTIAQSYIQEICRLTEIKANKDLVILDLKNKNAALQKENAELKKQIEELRKPPVD